MIEQSLKYKSIKVNVDYYQVVYNLIFRNTLYSLECYKEDFDKDNSVNYCLIEDFTDDEGEAETFLRMMAKGKVNPVHIPAMAEDYF